MSMLLQDNVAIVTGSAVGIGRGIAIALAERGAQVACLDIDDANNEQTAELVRATGRESLAIHCDVAVKTQVKSAVDQTLERFGRIDVLINNAAVWDDSSLLGGTYESQTLAYDQAMGVCAMGAYYCARACVPAMVEAGGGNILNIITEHVKEGHYLTGQPALGYDCAKFSMWRQVETWAVELRKSNIRVNGLCFGATDTPLLRGVSPRHADAGMKPADIGQAVINVLAHGEGGPSGETWLFGPTGTPRADSLVALATIGPGGESA
jgi:NAD(P)-dependent dehydrogenase (short-subunit alcohol dehydrogenase family)